MRLSLLEQRVQLHHVHFAHLKHNLPQTVRERALQEVHKLFFHKFVRLEQESQHHQAEKEWLLAVQITVLNLVALCPRRLR